MPSFFLVWYLLYLRGDKFPLRLFFNSAKPESDTLVSLALALPGLLAIGLGISFISPIFSTIPIGPIIEAPQGVIPWLVMAFSCAGTGYLEESFFRYYLLTRFATLPRAPIPGIVISAILFSLCHIYEGPWGVLNAFLAGILMSFIFLRYGSLHGIAWAHGLYNIFVYTFGM
ncbi:MAG: CPBP family intramembrane metalloprotease [Treponema sp.]|jgi:membrane protease YdiL (CAAX protease family)|nr:CPBP family intramembrane metalloprotease [Treponema sp.]